ncbi:MAG: GAF domain-containing protein [Desulfobacterales bacterium]|jgi:GAF domain-containing protein
MTKNSDYFKTFCKVSQAFGTAATEDKLLGLVVRSATEALDGKAACIYLADEHNDLFVPKAQHGLSKDYMHANPLTAGKLVKALLKEGHLVFEDATKDPRLENRDAKAKEGIASILTVPVRVTDRLIGILSLYTAKRRKFSNAEIEFLDALADQGGVAIEKTRLLERIQSNALMFLDLASAINSTLDIKEVLNIMTVKVSANLGLKGAAIRLLDEDSGSLKLVASHGLSDEFRDVGRHTGTDISTAALKGETVIIEDTATDKRVRYKDELAAEGIASMVVTPIKARDQIIGTLRLYSAQKRQYPEDMLILVQALAHQGGLAIQNASMFLKLQAEQKELEADVWSHRSWF